MIPPILRSHRHDDHTMGWPIADGGGSGTLVYKDDVQGIKISLLAFVVYAPQAFQPGPRHGPGARGREAHRRRGRTTDTSGSSRFLRRERLRSPPRTRLHAFGRREDRGPLLDRERDVRLRRCFPTAPRSPRSPSAHFLPHASAPPNTHTWQVLPRPAGRAGGRAARSMTRPPGDPPHGLTLFYCDGQGSSSYSGQWNTNLPRLRPGYRDVEGAVPPETPVAWVNDPGNCRSTSNLQPGDEKTYGFCVSGGVVPQFYGMTSSSGGHRT